MLRVIDWCYSVVYSYDLLERYTLCYNCIMLRENIFQFGRRIYQRENYILLRNKVL